MNTEDYEYRRLVGEYRAPYVAAAIVIAILIKAEGQRFLGPLDANDGSNSFNEVFGIDMSRTTFEPSLDLMCQWGLGDRIEDDFATTRYIFYYDNVRAYYGQNWDDKRGLIYKIRALGDVFLREAVERSEVAATEAFERGERPGHLPELSAEVAAAEMAQPLLGITEMQRSVADSIGILEPSPNRIDWTKWGTISSILGIFVAVFLWYLS